MLITARYLVDRLRQPRTRADELLELRRRLIHEPGPQDVAVARGADPGATNQATGEERRLAEELAVLRVETSRAIGAVGSCSGCSRGHAWPEGQWHGGFCCSSPTEVVFTDHEVAALRLSGTRPGDLRPPRSDHAGCAMRGPTGCSLPPRHRPTVCVRYFCGELRRELARRGDLLALQERLDRMEDVFDAFVAARSRRMERRALAELHPDLPDLPLMAE